MRSNKKEPMPGVFELAELLRGVQKDVDKAVTVSKFHATRLWDVVPPGIDVLRSTWGGWYQRGLDSKKALVEGLTQQVILDGRWNDQPVELARRYTDLSVFFYGQCPRKGHWLHVSPYDGVEPADLITDSGALKSVLNGGLITGKFAKQVGICSHHAEGTCVACAKVFRLADQEPRFWSNKIPECQTCLEHYLMYVEAKHDTRRFVVRKGRKRYIFRQGKWEMEPVPVPLGVDSPSPPKEEVSFGSVLDSVGSYQYASGITSAQVANTIPPHWSDPPDLNPYTYDN